MDDGGDLDFLEHPSFAVEAATDAFLDVVKNTSESLQSKTQLCRALAAALRCFLRCPATKVLVAPVIGEMTRELSDELSMNETEVLQQAVEALKCCGAWPAAMEVNGLETKDEQKRCVGGLCQVFMKAFRLWVDLMPVTYQRKWSPPASLFSIKYTGHPICVPNRGSSCPLAKKTGFIGIVWWSSSNFANLITQAKPFDIWSNLPFHQLHQTVTGVWQVPSNTLSAPSPKALSAKRLFWFSFFVAFSAFDLAGSKLFLKS